LDGEMMRKTPCFVLKIEVLCWFSIEAVHWLLGPANLSNLEFYTGFVRKDTGYIHQNAIIIIKYPIKFNMCFFFIMMFGYIQPSIACGIYGVQLSSCMHFFGPPKHKRPWLAKFLISPSTMSTMSTETT
jgi:hypothetical protein